jgi:uncharacterized protein (TIGR02246 family)
VRFLTPEVALVRSNAAVARARKRTRGNARLNTSIAVRIEGRWLFAASQNTTTGLSPKS